MKGHQFLATDKVAHIGNLGNPMWVEEIKFRLVNQSTGNVSSGKDGSEFEKTKKRRIDGIICYWFDDHNALQKKKFHAHQLVPWHVAEQGQEKAEEWLEEVINYRPKPIEKK